MTTIILPPTSLLSGRSSLLRGTYDAQPLRVEVRDPERLLCPIAIISGDETLLTLNKHDARTLAAALTEAAKTTTQKGGA